MARWPGQRNPGESRVLPRRERARGRSRAGLPGQGDAVLLDLGVDGPAADAQQVGGGRSAPPRSASRPGGWPGVRCAPGTRSPPRAGRARGAASSCMSPGRSRPSRQSTTPASRAFLSSRTFPGQAWVASSRSVSGASRGTGFFWAAQKAATNRSARSGMSSPAVPKRRDVQG